MAAPLTPHRPRLLANRDPWSVRLSYTTSPRRPATRQRRLRPSGHELRILVAFVLITALVAALGSIVGAAQVDGWYARAEHVTWTPPDALFGVVWSVLYLMIAASGWLIWLHGRQHEGRVALAVFVAQLAVNAFWTPLFFGGYPLIGVAALWLAVGVIVLLDLLVVATIALAWPVSKAAALLLVPYLAWILYASTLNWGDAVLASLG